MFDLPKKIIILDAEYTAWQGSLRRRWSGPNEHREVVQIAAILADTEKFIELDNFDLLVKPVKNPVLSEYFINLTGITQVEVDQKGISFEEALSKFFAWSGDRTIFSFGGDERVLKENCRLVNIKFPFEDFKYGNLIDIFGKYIPEINKYQSGNILAAFGKKSVLHQHNALNDCRILLDGLRELAARENH